MFSLNDSVMKSLLSARAIWLLLGKDRFQNLVNDWFLLLSRAHQTQPETDVQYSISDFSSNGWNNVSILSLLEKVAFLIIFCYLKKKHSNKFNCKVFNKL